MVKLKSAINTTICLESGILTAEQGAPLRVLGSKKNIDFTVIATHALFTVPAGQEAVVVAVKIKVRQLSAPPGKGSTPSVELGIDGSSDVIYLATALSGITVVNDTYQIPDFFNVNYGGQKLAVAGETIEVRVSSGAGVATFKGDIDVIGYTQ